MNSTSTPARREALVYLRESLSPRRGAPPDRRRIIGRLPEADRAFFVELVTGVARHALTIDAVMSAYSHAEWTRIPKETRAVLRLAGFELLFHPDAPAHAVVHQGVELVPRRFGQRSRRFVNALLRTIERTRKICKAEEWRPGRRDLLVDDKTMVRLDRHVFPNPSVDHVGWLADHFGFPREAVEMILAERGPEVTETLLREANRRPVATLRPTGDHTALEIRERLAAEGVELPTEDDAADGLLRWNRRGDPVSTTSFREGAYVVQGPFAAQVSERLELASGQRVLDLCAAPGGKTVLLAEKVGAANVTAVAVDRHGERRLHENLERLGFTDVRVLRVEKSLEDLPDERFDAVLVDAPCSNSGVLGRRPEARHRLTRKHLDDLGRLQDRLVDAALARLGPGGCLVYSTCSILAEENAERARAATTRHPSLRLVDETETLPLTPDQDGGYAARFVFESSNE